MPQPLATGAPDFIETLDHGIHVVDTGFHRPRFDASYLMVEGGRGAFVDTGTNHSVPRLMAAVQHAGLAPEDIDWVIATHVHLDHAGGAGLLMQQLPRAKLVVHPRGARHLVDPSALMAGARAVYGDDEVARSYGEVMAVPAERVHSPTDGGVIELAGRPLVFLDAPGHARHHHVVWDAASRGFFTGDTFGLSYREFDGEDGAWAMPTTTPVQFEPGPLRTSIERMLAFEPACMYLTHYGRVSEPARLGAMLIEQLGAIVAMAEAVPAGPGRHAALREGVAAVTRASLARHGDRRDAAAVEALLDLDFELNAQGLAVWLDRKTA